MADLSWRNRAQLQDDVVFFRYVGEVSEKNIPEVFVWDLDKTYLDTSIDSLKGLFSAVVEKALSKKNIPGTNLLLQLLSQKWVARMGQPQFPIYFITASPPQMEERIREKLLLDKIQPFGCFYKDNLKNLAPKRWWRLTKQVGYKIQALLQLRARLGENVKQIFWGDDSESDAVIYNLYSDICARRIGSQKLRTILANFFVTGEQVDRILLLQAEIPPNDPVEKIYINLAIDTDSDYYLKFGRRTTPTSNTFEIALDLFQNQRLELEDVEKIALELIHNYGFSVEELTRSFDDLIRQQVIGEKSAAILIPFLTDRGFLPVDFQPTLAPAKETLIVEGRVYEMEGQFEPWVQEKIDYLHDYR